MHGNLLCVTAGARLQYNPQAISLPAMHPALGCDQLFLSALKHPRRSALSSMHSRTCELRVPTNRAPTNREHLHRALRHRALRQRRNSRRKTQLTLLPQLIFQQMPIITSGENPG